MYTSIDIAKKIILNTDVEKGDIISNLKLQKLLYYLQGYSLAIFEYQLFNDKIEAWTYGPVVPTVYHAFKEYGASGINLPMITEAITLNSDEEELFSQVMAEYGQFGGLKLMKMTHEEEPWKLTYNNGNGSKAIIGTKLLQDYFKTLI